MDLGREDRDDASRARAMNSLTSGRNGSRSRGPRRQTHRRRTVQARNAAMDLGREDRDDDGDAGGRRRGRGAAMDLGREDRDDRPSPATAVMTEKLPQWISVARTETTERVDNAGPRRGRRNGSRSRGPRRLAMNVLAAVPMPCRNGSRSRGPRRHPEAARERPERDAAMDLGREDRDDPSMAQRVTPGPRPQWISVARTETTRNTITAMT